MSNSFQRIGSTSNTQVGSDFEDKALAYFSSRRITLHKRVSVSIGVNGKKPHNFDLGDTREGILVECKSHTWTEGGNVPSAKMTTWNEAMYFFFAAPKRYRKILFVLHNYSQKRQETLAEYYIRTYSHLIPRGVEIWEFDEREKKAQRIDKTGR